MDSDEERDYEEIEYYSRDSTSAPTYTAATVGIVIGIEARETRGSGLKKHIEYLIKGEDKNGQFSVWRRFNEFHVMRGVMVKSWPGCLIPSIPSKNPLLKNEEEMSRKRERYLDDFVRKMALRAHLYYSEEFQAFLRSEEKNLSDTFEKWPLPSADSVINRYKDIFSVLAGKEISQITITFIFEFTKRLEYNHELLLTYRKMAKDMAFQRDRYNKFYLDFFKAAKSYQETVLAEFVPSSQLLYGNTKMEALSTHLATIETAVTRNPYWLLYDLIKNEERDGRAFMELLYSIEHYGDRARDIQGKIESNVKGISEASAGKKNLKTLTMKGTTDEIKYQLEVENENLKKEKEQSQTLRDIVTALVAFVEIAEYKQAKKKFYDTVLMKLVSNELLFMGKVSTVWSELRDGIEKMATNFA